MSQQIQSPTPDQSAMPSGTTQSSTSEARSSHSVFALQPGSASPSQILRRPQRGLSARELLHLQRSIGNRAVTALLTSQSRRPSALQRTINYESKCAALNHPKSRKDLINAVKRKFPHLIDVETIITDIEDDDEDWSLFDVYRHISAEAKKVAIPIVPQSGKDVTIAMPSNPKHAYDYGFTRRTRARGFIRREDGATIPLTDATQENANNHNEDQDRDHAEDSLMQQIDNLLSSQKVDGTETIYITINNSPCRPRCAQNLADWYKAKWKGRMVIRYANPHGSEKDFMEAREILSSAGIEIKSFPAEQYIDQKSLSQGQKERFAQMKLRRKKVRLMWKEKHPDAQSDDSDIDNNISDNVSNNIKNSNKNNNENKNNEKNNNNDLILENTEINPSSSVHHHLSIPLSDQDAKKPEHTPPLSPKGDEKRRKLNPKNSLMNLDLGHAAYSGHYNRPLKPSQQQRRKPLRERISLSVEGSLMEFDPDETPNGGSCFFQSLIALNEGGNRTIAELRQLARDNGARAAILGEIEWARIEDIEAVAQGLGRQIVVVALDLDYNISQITRRGLGNPPIYIAQVFGGHFVPLRRIG